MPVERIGRYQITGEIGKGAMGLVYKATDPNIGRTVALKTMRLDVHGMESEEMLRRFRNEARAAGLLNHPNIVTIYDAGEQEGIFYIAMEFIEGRTLQEILKVERVLNPDKTADIIRQVCAGLDYAHARGIVHRDVKPANIMVQAGGTAKIMDFGIAKSAGTGITSTGQVMGTPNYMSPEQVKGRPVDGRSDLFSVGVILYECLTGERPFAGENVTTIIYKLVNENPPAPSDLDVTVPPAISAVVMRALAKTPETRFQSGTDLAWALSMHGAPGEAPETTPMVTPPTGISTGARAAAMAPAAATPAAAPAPQMAKLDSTVMRPVAPAPAPPPRKSRATTAVLAAALVIVLAAVGYIALRPKPGVPAPAQPAAATTASPAAASGATPPAAPPATETSAQPGAPAPQVPPATPPAESAAKPSAAKSAEPPPASAGELRVTSKPPGAAATIDGRGDPAWITPFTAPRLKPGAHRVTLSLDGYTPQTRDVEVAAGKRASLNTELAATETQQPLQPGSANPLRKLKRLFGAEERGTLEVRTLPRGAQIWLNGKPTPRRTPVRVPVPTGTYRIGLRLPGYKPVERTITIEKGKLSAVDEILEKQ
jgi:predicted Ser/Thr protein kinase